MYKDDVKGIYKKTPKAKDNEDNKENKNISKLVFIKKSNGYIALLRKKK